MKRFIYFSISFLILVLSLSFKSLAERNNINLFMECLNTDVQQGENLLISLCGNSENIDNISTFRTKIHFDSSKISYKGIYPKGILTSNEFKVNVTDNCITIIYLTKSTGFYLDSDQDTQILDIKFTVNNDCPIGESIISTELDSVCNYDIQEIFSGTLNDIYLQISEPTEPDCTLLFLEPSEGTLNPDFNPNILDYEVDVPYSTKIITFNAEPKNESCTVKISRKTLNSAGSPTLIKITVSDTPSKNKLIYTVTVNRLPKTDSNNKNNSSESSSKKPKKKSSYKTKSSKTTPGKTKVSKNIDSQDEHDKHTNHKLNANKHPDKSVNSNNASQSSDYDNISTPERTFILRENQFNSFLAGVFTILIISLLSYIIFIKIKSKNNLNKEEQLLENS